MPMQPAFSIAKINCLLAGAREIWRIVIQKGQYIAHNECDDDGANKGLALVLAFVERICLS